VHIGVVTLFPQMLEDALSYGVVGRGRKDGRWVLELENPRDWAKDKHRTVDDRPFGGGPGMVMKPDPLSAAIKSMQSKLTASAPVVYLSPQGQTFNQSLAMQWQSSGDVILVAGRYEGVDERVVDALVDTQVSVGDFVLSGGEFAALTIIDTMVRLIPGVLGDPLSSKEDSFGEDGLLDCPHFTRPEVYEGVGVPEVLLSGDHRAIARWRRQQALARTRDLRPDLLEKAKLTQEDKIFLNNSVSGPS